MKSGQILLIVGISVLVSLATVSFANRHGQSVGQPATKESAYERVMRTGVIRCGYVQYPKFVERDLKTGKFSGIYYDLTEEIAKQLSLKVEWTEEVPVTSAFDGLAAGRYDLACIPFNQIPSRARATEFTIPVFFWPTYAYVRANDSRFDKDYRTINDPSVKFSYLDGEFAGIVRAEEFPKTQAVTVPSYGDIPQVLMQVSTGKADIALTEPSSAEPFFIHNPDKLKRTPLPPIRIQASGYDVAVGETALKNMLDTTIRALHSTGFIKKVLDKYTTSPDQFFLPAKPWGESTQPLQPASASEPAKAGKGP